MRIYKFTEILNESKKDRKYNDMLKNLGVMDEHGDINLKDMTEKINQFLSKDGNKDKFMKDYDDKISPDVKVKNEKFKACDLKPSQTEIFLDHVLSRLVVNDEDRKQILKGEFKDHDILISSDGHIIDGHHRWLCAFILNPNCEMDCTEIEIPIEYALPVINAIIEASDKETDKLKDTYSINIFDAMDWKKEKLFKKMNSIIRKAIKNGVGIGEDKKKSDKFPKTKDHLSDINIDVTEPFYKKLKKKLKLDNHPLKHIRENMKQIPKPKELFSDRKDMPQLKKKDAKKLL
jgi:hypothetical protein